MWAQTSVGSVSLEDANVTGALQVSGGRAQMLGASTVTAGERGAKMHLARGGEVLICATSALHVTAGKGAATDGPVPLLLALDRGAVELHMAVSARDALMTPDLRFGVRSSGVLDLRIRVTNNGDTCVENRGAHAPSLVIGDAFGDGMYELRAEQHVLFEHGSLKEVVDHESSPCGCPAAPVISVADAGGTGGSPAAAGARVAPADQHPFPAAESQGLAPGGGTSGAAGPQAPSGTVHAQVAATLAYDASGAATRDSLAAPSGVAGTGAAAEPAATSGSAASTAVAPVVAAATPPGAPAVVAQAPAPEAPPSARDLGHRIGHFFKRIFGRG